MRKISIIIVLFLMCLSNARGQTKDSGVRTESGFGKQMKRDANNTACDSMIYYDRLLKTEITKTGIKEQILIQKETEYDIWSLSHRHVIFQFQYACSIGIFIIVILVVFSGLWFSSKQFNIAMEHAKLLNSLLQADQLTDAAAHSKQPSEQAETTESSTEAAEAKPRRKQAKPVQHAVGGDSSGSLKQELQISATGIKVQSSVLGVIVLTISIAFFYLYLIYVYPIQFVSDKAKTEAAPAKK